MEFGLNINMRKKDIINAQAASMKISLGAPVTVSGVAIVKDGGTDKQGNPCDVGYIACDEGVFGFISTVILKNLPLLADYLKDCLEDGEECKIEFISGKTAKDVEFYSFKVID